MKDFVSKITFGFLMAQLFPGAVGAFAISYAYFALEPRQVNAVLGVAYTVIARWRDAGVAQQLFLVAFCVAIGMVIHGLHWAALGAMEHRFGSVYRDRWHQRTIWKQVAGGPIRLLDEIRVLFFGTHDLRHASMDENVTRIDKDRMGQFEFLQEFYLSSGQFFMHTAYALTMTLTALVTFVVAYGLTWRRVVLLALLYLLIGIFFTLARVQLRSLFNAEEALADASKPAPEPAPAPAPKRPAEARI
jgi:hypothetical protein